MEDFLSKSKITSDDLIDSLAKDLGNDGNVLEKYISTEDMAKRRAVSNEL